MALVTCPDCKAEISDAAPACPKCGRRARGGVSIVRILLMLAIGVLLFGGCWIAALR
jgi:hypothetical protein